jgi:hypothetical protein
MKWTKKKPVQSGWYRYIGDLDAIDPESGRIHCDPSCRVAVHSGDDPFLAIYRDTRLFDYKKAEGLWSNPVEGLERPVSGELPDE